LGDTNYAGLESGLRRAKLQAKDVPAKRSGFDNGAYAVNGFWRNADWLGCRDGKWRPVGPGTFPLAYGVPARVGQLRAYGNAIVPSCAEVFIRAYLDFDIFG
jgi:DNA (cytosine-5)-methyltransferase 1